MLPVFGGISGSTKTMLNTNLSGTQESRKSEPDWQKTVNDKRVQRHAASSLPDSS
jgi:hypothetical protein